MASESAPRRLNKLAEILNSKSYLEIGVQKGLTFNNVNVAYKEAVDPIFRFDYLSLEGENTKFYQITSDKYFESLLSNKRKLQPNVFDLFFIDGLHTYDQTYRDFCNCLAVSNSESFFVIDDTFPADLYSSLRTQSVCKLRRSREAPNSSIREWRGDTYKVLLLINLFHTSYSYCTVRGDGPAQTFIWKTDLVNDSAYHTKPYNLSTLSNEMLFEYLGRINQLDYNWFLENQSLLQICENDDFFSWFSGCFRASL